MAVTRPLLLTVATDGVSELQVTLWLVASGGETVAVSWSVLPVAIVSAVLLRLTPVTGTACTVTGQKAKRLPPAVVAAIAVFVTPNRLNSMTSIIKIVNTAVLRLPLDVFNRIISLVPPHPKIDM
jgi:hypothetical protein